MNELLPGFIAACFGMTIMFILVLRLAWMYNHLLKDYNKLKDTHNNSEGEKWKE